MSPKPETKASLILTTCIRTVLFSVWVLRNAALSCIASHNHSSPSDCLLVTTVTLPISCMSSGCNGNIVHKLAAITPPVCTAASEQPYLLFVFL